MTKGKSEGKLRQVEARDVPGERRMSRLTLELPADLGPALHRSPRELVKEVQLAAAIDWYGRGLISQGRGAEIAGVSRADFIDALAARQVEVVQVDLEALDRELGFE